MVEHISLLNQFNNDVATNLTIVAMLLLWTLLMALIFVYKARNAFAGRREMVIREMVIMREALRQEKKTKKAKKAKKGRTPKEKKKQRKILQQQDSPPTLQNAVQKTLTSSTNVAEERPLLGTMYTPRLDDAGRQMPPTKDGNFNQFLHEKTIPTEANWKWAWKEEGGYSNNAGM